MIKCTAKENDRLFNVIWEGKKAIERYRQMAGGRS